MISVREGAFETNSSSCHSLTICKKDLMEKLKNYELIYVGDFEYGDDYGTYRNVLNPDDAINREQFLEGLKTFRDKPLADDVDPWYNGLQDFVKNHPELFDMSLKELIEYDHGEFDFGDIVRASNIWAGDYISASIMFGDVDDTYSDTFVIMEKDFLDPETKEPVKVLLTKICC